MTGRIAAALIIVVAILGGGAMYWLQVYAYYDRIEGGEVVLTTTAGETGAVPAEGLTAIDADSSPLRYRACFAHDLDPADYEPHPEAEPTVGPGWFDCYDAGEVDGALGSGEAVAVLGTADVTYGVDRVAALWPDRGVMWHQLNPCGEAVYAGRDAPEGCPPPPEEYRD